MTGTKIDDIEIVESERMEKYLRLCIVSCAFYTRLSMISTQRDDFVQKDG